MRQSKHNCCEVGGFNCTGYTPWNAERFDISVIQLLGFLSMHNTWTELLMTLNDSGATHFCVAPTARKAASYDLTLAALGKKRKKAARGVRFKSGLVPYAIPYEIMPYVTPILQVCESKWNPYWLIVLRSSSDSNYVTLATSMKMLTIMTHMQYHPRYCNVKAILKVWWIKMKSV